MGRDRHVGQLEERIVRAGGFGLEHVQPRAGNGAVPQGLRQIRLPDQVAPALGSLATLIYYVTIYMNRRE